MYGFVRLAAGIAPIPLRDRNTLPLPLAPILVVVARRRQDNLQQHVLHGFQHDLRHAARVGRQVGQVNDPRHREARTFTSNSRFASNAQKYFSPSSKCAERRAP